MAADSKSREVVRSAFAALLQAKLVGSGLPVQQLYDYLVGDFGGMSPVVVVSSGPIFRQQYSLGEEWQNTIQIYIYSFVLYSSPADSWTEENAEDAIDAIEKIVADVAHDNASNANWQTIRYLEPTTVFSTVIGGLEYKAELITLEFDVFD